MKPEKPSRPAAVYDNIVYIYKQQPFDGDDYYFPMAAASRSHYRKYYTLLYTDATEAAILSSTNKRTDKIGELSK